LLQILGLVNTSYYVRGQYTLIDTLPLGRERRILYPVGGDAETAPDELNGTSNGVDGVEASTSITAPPPPRSGAADAEASTTTQEVSRVITNSVDAPTTDINGTHHESAFSTLLHRRNAKAKEVEVPFIPPGTYFDFDLDMPNEHYRDSNVELPPSCQIIQIGMQAGVEYYLRVKLSRKGWRINES
jgi:hypothetical protein